MSGHRCPDGLRAYEVVISSALRGTKTLRVYAGAPAIAEAVARGRVAHDVEEMDELHIVSMTEYMDVSREEESA